MVIGAPSVVAAGPEATAPVGGRPTLIQAAKKHGLHYRSLRDLVDAGDVRCVERRRHGNGESIVFDDEQLREDLEKLPTCRARGCGARAAGTNGYCSEHFGQSGREAAHRAEDELLASARDWYTPREATSVAHCSLATIHSAIATGEFASERVGRHRRIPKVMLEQWAAAAPRGQKPGKRSRKPSAAELAQRREDVAALHGDGCGPGAIAKRLGWSKATINADLDALELERPGRGRRAEKMPPDERTVRRTRAGELYGVGRSIREIAGELGSSPTQIRRDLGELGVAIRPARRPAKYPEPLERLCVGCGEAFTPLFPSHGEQRFCCKEHALEARAKATRDALDERGLLSTRELAERWPGIGAHQVAVHVAEGRLDAEVVAVPGALRPVFGVTPEAADRFEREWARGGDGRRRVMEDPEQMLARRERDGTIERHVDRGLTREQARELVRGDALRRRQRFARRRRGRVRSTRPSERDLLWLGRVEQLLAEQTADYEQRVEHGLGDHAEKPSRWRVALTVAEEDWQQHRARWPDYPASPDDLDALDRRFARPAADRVFKAVERAKRLQKRADKN